MSSTSVVVQSGPVGIGGWLGLLAFGQTIGPLRTMGQMGISLENYKPTMTIPNGPAAFYGEVAINLAFCVLQVATAIALWRKSPYFQRLFLFQWIAIPVVLVVDMFWVSTSVGVSVDKVMSPELVGSTFGSFISVAPWVWYVFVSRRVRNTFVHPAPDTSAFA